MRDLENIAAILDQEVTCARDRVTEARRTVDDITLVPHTDGQRKLANATAELNTAREALERLLDRSAAFAFRGVVPEDLE